ncbi:unnamed protein product [Protopolystoma xenopodis]|uniref:Uncharacterized protein n=1 Tax=Protopolystoma xenopodis TaxID=117903 RepID=A0A448XMK1_9PLAT|nr:unnamed protein product [Protopolystoma xenopodis]
MLLQLQLQLLLLLPPLPLLLLLLPLLLLLLPEPLFTHASPFDIGSLIIRFSSPAMRFMPACQADSLQFMHFGYMKPDSSQSNHSASVRRSIRAFGQKMINLRPGCQWAAISSRMNICQPLCPSRCSGLKQLRLDLHELDSGFAESQLF